MTINEVANSGDNTGGGTSSSFATAFEGGYSATDDHVAVLTVHYGGTSLTATTPTDWTQVPGPTYPVDQGSNSRAYAYYRVLSNGDSAPTVTISGAATGGWLLTIFDGVDTADPFGQIDTATANAATLDIAELTGVVDDSTLVSHVHHRVPSGTTPPTAITPDGDYTELQDHQTSRNPASAQNVTMESAIRSGVSAGTYGGTGETFSNVGSVSGSWIGFHIELLASVSVVNLVAQDATHAHTADSPTLTQVHVLTAQNALHAHTADSPSFVQNTESLARYVVHSEFMALGLWTDISTRVQYDNGAGVSVQRGRSAQSATASPTNMTFMLDNTDHAMSPRNPNSAYWGKLSANTLFQSGVLLAQDSFDRTEVDGWGTADIGGSWSISGTAANFDVGSGYATVVSTVASINQHAYLSGSSVPRNLWARVNVSPLAVPASNYIECSILFRRSDADNYYFAYPKFNSDGTVQIGIRKSVAGVNSDMQPFADLDASIPYTADTTVQLSVAIYENFMYVRITDIANPTNTIDGYASDVDNSHPNSGDFGLRVVVFGAGNVPATVRFDDLVVCDIRGCVEIPEWPQQQDSTGTYKWVPVHGMGLSSRLDSTEPVLPAPPKQYILENAGVVSGALNIVAAWALDEGPTAKYGAPLVGRYSLQPFRGVHPSGGSIFTVPYFGRGSLASYLPPAFTWGGNADLAIMWAGVEYVDTGEGWVLYYCYSSSVDAPVSFVDFNPSYLVTDASTGWPQLLIDPANGELGATLDGDPELWGAYPTLFDGNLHTIQFWVYPDGSDLIWSIMVDGNGVVATTMVGDASAFPTVTRIGFGCENPSGKTAPSIGYPIFSANVGTAAGRFATSDGLCWSGERAGDRLMRLANENDIPLALLSTTADVADNPSGDDTPQMGPQRPGTLMAQFRECEAIDGGVLFEAPNFPGFVYHTRASLSNQTARLALDYAAKAINEPFEPDSTRTHIVNSITLSRYDGITVEYIKVSGSLNVNNPTTDPDGAGLHAQSATVNAYADSQLLDLASQTVHIGTVDEDRYTAITTQLHRDYWTNNPSLYVDATEIGVSDRISLANLPDNLTPGTQALLAMGTSEVLTQVSRELRFSAVPASGYDVAIWDTSKFATEGSYLKTAVNTTATAIDIGVSKTGTLWTTDGGELPISAIMEGETLSITGVAISTLTMGTAGAADHGNNASVTPGLPSGHTSGDLLVIFAAIWDTAASPIAPTDYVTLVDFGNVVLFGKIDNGSESAPTVTFTGGASGDTTTAQMFYVRGLYGFYDITQLVVNSHQYTNASAQDVNVTATGIFEDNCLVLRMAWKQDNWTSVAALSGYTELIDTSTTTGNDQAIALDYAVQTTRTPLTGDTFTVTGGGSAVSKGMTVILRPDVQRLTVTRSINGVVKAQTVNSPLKLYPRSIWALR